MLIDLIFKLICVLFYRTACMVDIFSVVSIGIEAQISITFDWKYEVKFRFEIHILFFRHLQAATTIMNIFKTACDMLA